MKPLQPFEIPFYGSNIVEASAGTGKTYNITSLYIRALLEYQKEVGEILVVTYTEAATQELRDRLQKRMREAIRALKGDEVPDNDQFLMDLIEHVEDKSHALACLQKAVHSFDEASVFTIHGFCYQALQEQAFESGMIFDAELMGDDHEIVLDVIDDYWRSWISEASADRMKRPLLKLLTDRGYGPVALTQELGPYVGKPYLQILPEQEPVEDVNDQLAQLFELHTELKLLWAESREEIFVMLDSGNLSYYRTDWLEGWMAQMDEWLRPEVPPIRLFERFGKFEQSSINNSMKKAAVRDGISPPQHPFFRTVERYGQIAEMLSYYDVSFRKNLLQHLHQTLGQRKDELQVLSFDDLLVKLNRALSHPDRGQNLAKALRTKYPVALVDEFQDTDPVQYDIFHTIYSQPQDRETALFMIGDPKQSIYSFRGADIFAYLQARREIDADRIFSLGHNYRSVPSLLEAVNTIFERHPDPFLLEGIPFKPVKPGRTNYAEFSRRGPHQAPLQIRNLSMVEASFPLKKNEAEQLAAADTAQQIVELIEAGKEGDCMIGDQPVQARDIAVLVRTHKQADIISQALQERNVKSVQYSQQSVFYSLEAAELELVLRAVAEPASESRIKSALSTRLMGLKAQDILELEGDEQKWIEKLQQFSSWHHAWQERGFSFMFRAWLRDSKSFCQIIEYENGERMLTNVRHMAELLQAEEQEHQRGMRGLIRWLARKRREEDRNLEHEQLRLESDEELVKVVTMHRSKGLEYPIVFCPFLWHGKEYNDRGLPLVFHDHESGNTYLDLLGKNDPQRSAKRMRAALEDLAEGVRLAYVALTRAEQRCYVTWLYEKKSECSPFGYLLLSPEEVQSVLKSIIDSGDSYSSIGLQRFEQAMAKLVEAGSDAIEVVYAHPEAKIKKWDGETQVPEFGHRNFTRNGDLEPEYAVTSFSSLMRQQDNMEDNVLIEPYLDEAYTDPVSEEVTREKNIFTFPKGPQPGTCIHKIFEEVDFTLDNAPEIVEKNLRLFGIDIGWKRIVHQMLNSAVSISLLNEDPGLKLSAIRPEDMIHELEFYYKIGSVQKDSLIRLIRNSSVDGESGAEPKPQGFMKGFIDLTFRYEGKFYILDYKTNYLGNSIQDYSIEKLSEEMVNASYDLQYHIYTIALHRYLAMRLPAYSYERHFGGIFYLFVRGMNESGREGIFFDRPEEQTILSLNQYLEEGA